MGARNQATFLACVQPWHPPVPMSFMMTIRCRDLGPPLLPIFQPTYLSGSTQLLYHCAEGGLPVLLCPPYFNQPTCAAARSSCTTERKAASRSSSAPTARKAASLASWGRTAAHCGSSEVRTERLSGVQGRGGQEGVSGGVKAQAVFNGDSNWSL